MCTLPKTIVHVALQHLPKQSAKCSYFLETLLPHWSLWHPHGPDWGGNQGILRALRYWQGQLSSACSNIQGSLTAMITLF